MKSIQGKNSPSSSGSTRKAGTHVGGKTPSKRVPSGKKC